MNPVLSFYFSTLLTCVSLRSLRPSHTLRPPLLLSPRSLRFFAPSASSSFFSLPVLCVPPPLFFNSAPCLLLLRFYLRVLCTSSRPPRPPLFLIPPRSLRFSALSASLSLSPYSLPPSLYLCHIHDPHYLSHTKLPP